MRHHVYFSTAGLLAAISIYRELWAEIPGTGQSVMNLLHAGYSRTEIGQYFPSTTPFVDIIVFSAAVVLTSYGADQVRRLRSSKEET